MADQLWQAAGLGVIGLPGLEFGMMSEEQFGEVERVFAIVLGAAGDKGLAEFLKRDGIDGVEGDPEISLEEKDEAGGGLLQPDGHTRFGIFLAQAQKSIAQRFR